MTPEEEIDQAYRVDDARQLGFTEGVAWAKAQLAGLIDAGELEEALEPPEDEMALLRKAALSNGRP